METNENIKLYISFDDTIQEIFINQDSTIEELKLIIEATINIPLKDQILLYKKSILKNEDSLEQYNISNNKVIELKIKKYSNKTSMNNENKLINQQTKNDNKIYKKQNDNKKSENSFLEIGSDIVKTISNALNSPNEVNNLLQSPIYESFVNKDSDIKNTVDNFYNSKNFNKIKTIVDVSSGILSLISGRNYQDCKGNNNNNDSSDEEKTNKKNTYYKNNNYKYEENNNNYKQKYKKQLKTLNEMGFNDDIINISLLKKFNGDIEKCINDYYN